MTDVEILDRITRLTDQLEQREADLTDDTAMLYTYRFYSVGVRSMLNQRQRGWKRIFKP